ncbi:hypothetical protein EOM81_13145, partial [bacterium]|nr:hypothetical protein [bacterium]
TLSGGNVAAASKEVFQGKGAGANIALKSNKVCVQLATSYLGFEQAYYNLKKEVKSFEETKKQAAAEWESLLSKIQIEADDSQKRIFYSCLYRAFLYPTKFFETDKDGQTWHVNPETNEIKKGVMYTNNGFWDTYRTVYPLYSLIAPSKYAEIVDGYLNFYDDTGYLPRWPSPSEFGCMPGTLIEPVLADAVIKNIIPEKQARRALNAMLKNAEVQSMNPLQGRKSIDEYQKLGYIPNDSQRESVNETLDCAYGDYCIARVAEFLKEQNDRGSFISVKQSHTPLLATKKTMKRNNNDTRKIILLPICRHDSFFVMMTLKTKPQE